MSAEPTILQQPTDEQILRGIREFLLPLAKLAREVAATRGQTAEQMLEEMRQTAEIKEEAYGEVARSLVTVRAVAGAAGGALRAAGPGNGRGDRPHAAAPRGAEGGRA